MACKQQQRTARGPETETRGFRSFRTLFRAFYTWKLVIALLGRLWSGKNMCMQALLAGKNDRFLLSAKFCPIGPLQDSRGTGFVPCPDWSKNRAGPVPAGHAEDEKIDFPHGWYETSVCARTTCLIISDHCLNKKMSPTFLGPFLFFIDFGPSKWLKLGICCFGRLIRTLMIIFLRHNFSLSRMKRCRIRLIWRLLRFWCLKKVKNGTVVLTFRYPSRSGRNFFLRKKLRRKVKRALARPAPKPRRLKKVEKILGGRKKIFGFFWKQNVKKKYGEFCFALLGHLWSIFNHIRALFGTKGPGNGTKPRGFVVFQPFLAVSELFWRLWKAFSSGLRVRTTLSEFCTHFLLLTSVSKMC